MQPIYILQPISSIALSHAEIQLPITGQIKIGREASNDFSFPNDTKMSSAHFELIAEAGCCRVRDLGSSNGLFLNTKRIAAALLVEGDELLAGESRWRVVVRGGQPAPYTAETPLDQSHGFASPPVAVAPLPSCLVHAEGALTDLQLTSDRGVIRMVQHSERLTVGRTVLANWVFEHDGQMSSIHLELFCEAEGWRVKDLGSSNGTFLNESRVSEASLRTGDEIRAGQTRFVVALHSSAKSVQASNQEANSQPNPSALTGYSPIPRPVAVELPPVQARPVQSPPASMPLKQQADVQRLTRSLAHLRRVSDGREYELPVGTAVHLGRGHSLPISLPDDLQVSTQHATVIFDGQYVQLQDTGSFNGTYVGAQRVTNCQLLDGQRFRVGQTVLLVCLPHTEPLAEHSRPTVFEPTPSDDSSVPQQMAPHESNPTNVPSHSQRRDALIVPVRRLGGADVDRVVHGESDDGSDVESKQVNRPESLPPPATRDEPWIASPSVDNAKHVPARQVELDSEQRLGSDREKDASVLCHDSESRATNSEGGGGNIQQTEAVEMPVEIAEPSTMSSTDGDLEAVASIDWETPATYATAFSEIEGVVCRSGLIVYRGLSSGLDPVDVGLRILQITSGWVLNGSEIENWMEAARQGLTGLPREWLNPAQTDDASWMLPFLSNWGSGQAWLIFSSVDLDDALQNILSLRPINEDAPPLMPALTPQALANFLAEHDRRAVERFFQPFDAIMLEIRAGQSWALFSRQNLQAALRQ